MLSRLGRLRGLSSAIARNRRRVFVGTILTLIVAYIIGIRVDVESQGVTLSCIGSDAPRPSGAPWARDLDMRHYYYDRFGLRSTLLDADFIGVRREYERFTGVRYTSTRTETRIREESPTRIVVTGIVRPAWRPPENKECIDADGN